MSNETVTYSLEAVLTRIEGKIDSLEKRLDEKIDSLEKRIDEKSDYLEKRIYVKIDSLEKRIDERFDKIEDRLTKVEIGQAGLKGEIKALDERVSTKIEGLTARVAYQEFTNRGILIALVVAILGGAAKLFGFFPNP
jgi:chromosome segregation ATPase